MESEAVCYELDADATKLVSNFEKSLRTMMKTAAGAGKLEQAQDKLQASTEKVGKAAEKAELNLGDLAGGLEQISPTMGGIVQVADELKQGIGAVTASFGPWGLAAAAVAVSMVAAAAAVVGVTTAAFGITDAAVEATTRLDEMGLSALIPEQARASLVEYSAAQRELAIAIDEVVVLLGAEFAPMLADIVTAGRGAILMVREWKDEIVALGSTLTNLVTMNSPFFALIEQGWIAGREALNRYAESVDDVPNLGESMLGNQDVPGVLKEIADAEKARADASKAAAAAAKERAAQELAALREIEAEHRANAAAGNARTKELQAQYDKWTAAKLANDKAMLAAEKVARDKRKAEADKAAAEEEAARLKRDEDIKAGIEQGVVGTIQALADIASARAEARIAEADADMERSRTKLAALQEELNSGKKMSTEERNRILARIDTERKAQKEIAKERKKAGNAARAAAIGQAIIGASLAIIQCFAQLGPIGGAIAAVPVGIATGAEIAAISKQTFHDGGRTGHGPDEFRFGAGQTGRKDEEAFVFNQRAKQNGAVEAAERWNRGDPPSARSGGGTLVLADSSRVIGQAVALDMQRPGSPLAVGRGDGARNPFRSRR